MAWMLLTRLPAPKNLELSKTDAKHSQRFYPLIGFLLGCLIAFGLRLEVLGSQIIAVLMITVYVLITGALHIDGLADTADGWLGGQGDRERTLQIMRDSQTGVAGVVAIVLLLLGYFVGLSALNSSALFALPWIFAGSRWLCVLLMQSTVNASRSQLAGDDHNQSILIETIAVGGLIALGLIFAVGIFKTLLIMVVVTVTATLMQSYMSKRLGGHTGDGLGAVIEITQWLSILLLAALSV